MKVKMSSPNLKQITGGIKALIHNIPIASKQSSKIVAYQVLNASLNDVPSCPEDTGDLRSTARVEAVQEGYAVTYGGQVQGGKFVDYAAYVHDDLRPRKYKRPGSGPKFVETHMLRAAETAPPKIGRTLQDLVDEIFRTYRGEF